MTIEIPRTIDYTIKEGDRGIVVFSVQRTCNRLTAGVIGEDMDWGPATTKAAKALQYKLGVEGDGIYGPATQQALAKFICNQSEVEHGLPQNLIFSVVAYESGGYLGAVNWSVAGGVDCGVTQRRVYDEQYSDDAAVKRAFDPVYQVRLSASSFDDLYGIFLGRPGTGGNRQLAYRLAVLNHNYPSLADRISRDGISGLSSYYRSPQTWVTDFGLKFTDGALIRTPLEWGQRYALGNSAHDEPGQAVKLVRSWTA